MVPKTIHIVICRGRHTPPHTAAHCHTPSNAVTYRYTPLQTHIIIESEASGVVSAIYDAVNAIKEGNVNRLMAMLAWLEQAMSHVSRDCLGVMFERQVA